MTKRASERFDIRCHYDRKGFSRDFCSIEYGTSGKLVFRNILFFIPHSSRGSRFFYACTSNTTSTTHIRCQSQRKQEWKYEITPSPYIIIFHAGWNCIAEKMNGPACTIKVVGSIEESRRIWGFGKQWHSSKARLPLSITVILLRTRLTYK